MYVMGNVTNLQIWCSVMTQDDGAATLPQEFCRRPSSPSLFLSLPSAMLSCAWRNHSRRLGLPTRIAIGGRHC